MNSSDDITGSIRGHLIVLIVLTLVVAASQAWQVLQGVSSHRQQWQYAIEAPKDEELNTRLTELGSDGWEIVSARRATSDGTASYEMILRRPLSSTEMLVPIPLAR